MGVWLRWGLLLCLLSPAAWASDDWQYTLRPSDTLWTVCERFAQEPMSCWRQLARHNGIKDPRRLHPGSLLGVPVAWLKEKPIPASLEAVHGQVQLYPADGGPVHAVQSGDKVQFGDALETSANGSARIRFADQSEVLIKPSTLLVVTHYRRFLGGQTAEPTELHLERGAIRNHVTPRDPDTEPFKVYTPGAAAAVRGTQYYVRVDGEETTRSEVVKGQVNVSAQDTEKDVKGGFATLARQDQAPIDPVALLPAPAVVVTTTPAHIKALWPTQKAAAGYWLELYHEPGDTMLEQDYVSQGEWDHKLAPGKYRLLVRAEDANGLRGKEHWETLTVPDLPPPPPPAPEKHHHELLIFGIGAALLLAL
ncbi:MAG: FecR domain-containing protein [Alcanivorax sp.]|nr:FecR domain-containing protein [Alcanivorax sp.]